MNYDEAIAAKEAKRPLREAFVAGVVATALEDVCGDVEVGDAGQPSFVVEWTGFDMVKVQAPVNAAPTMGDRYRITVAEEPPA